jgi:hypothetical protein
LVRALWDCCSLSEWLAVRPGDGVVAIDIASDITRNGIDFQLWFATYVLGLRSLHYGYWDDPENTTLNLDEVVKHKSATLIIW